MSYIFVSFVMIAVERSFQNIKRLQLFIIFIKYKSRCKSGYSIGVSESGLHNFIKNLLLQTLIYVFIHENM